MKFLFLQTTLRKLHKITEENYAVNYRYFKFSTLIPFAHLLIFHVIYLCFLWNKLSVPILHDDSAAGISLNTVHDLLRNLILVLQKHSSDKKVD